MEKSSKTFGIGLQEEFGRVWRTCSEKDYNAVSRTQCLIVLRAQKSRTLVGN